MRAYKESGGADMADKVKQQPSKKLKTKRGLVILLIVAAIVVFITLLLVIFTRAYETTPLQNASMTSYLDKKYGQDFVVQNVRLEGAGLGAEGEIVADAYPKNDPSVKFKISKTESNWANDTYFRDAFLTTLWTKQAKPAVETFLKQTMPGLDDYQLTVGVSVGDSLYKNVNGSTPSFSDILQKGETGFSYDLSVRAAGQMTQSEPSEPQLEYAFKLLTFVRQQGSVAPSLEYVYRDTNFHETYSQTGTQAYQYKITLSSSAIKLINSPSDLKQYFEGITLK